MQLSNRLATASSFSFQKQPSHSSLHSTEFSLVAAPHATSRRSQHTAQILKRLLFSPETLFVLFLLPVVSGLQTPIPISITKLCGVLSLFAATYYVLIRSKPYPHADWPSLLPLFIIFLGIAALSASQTRGEYSSYKITVFATYTMWAYLGGLIFASSRLGLHRCLAAFVAITAVCSCIALLAFALKIPLLVDPDTMDRSRAGAGTGNPIPLGRAAGGSILVVLYCLMIRRHRTKFTTGALLTLFTLFVVTMVASGSRGPVVALLLTASAFAVPRVLWGRIQLGAIAKAGAALTLTLILVAFAVSKRSEFQHSTSRLTGSLAQRSNADSLTSGRTHLYPAAMKLFRSNPVLGAGFGSFANHVASNNMRVYPHNLVLEIAAELGLLGLLGFLLFALPGISLMSQQILSKRSIIGIPMLVSVLLLFFLLNAMVSGDINDNRVLFFFLAASSSIKTNLHVYA